MNPSFPFTVPPNPPPGSAVINIQNVKQVTTIDAQGKADNQLQITFMVGSHGPFTQLVDKNNFNPHEVQQALRDFAQKIATLHGYA